MLNASLLIFSSPNFEHCNFVFKLYANKYSYALVLFCLLYIILSQYVM